MDLIIYGSGGHGAVVLDAALARGQRLLGFVDDHAPVGAVVLGFPVLGGEAWLAAHGPARVALGIGSNAVRRRIWERCRLLRLEVVTIVHPRACVSTFAELGVGAVVLAGAVINARARVGLGAIVNSGAVVEHDVALGDFSHVSPNATLAGAAALGVESQLGASACVLPGIAIGDYAIVGAGAVVTRSLPSHCVARGVPARIFRTIEA